MKINDLDVVAREGFEPSPLPETKDLPRNSSAVADIADSETTPRYKSDTKRRVMPNHELLNFLWQREACEPSIKWLQSRDSDQMWADCERPDWLMWWAYEAGVPSHELVSMAAHFSCIFFINYNGCSPVGFTIFLYGQYKCDSPGRVAAMCDMIRQRFQHCPIPTGWGQEK